MERIEIGRITVLVGERGGKYPSGNSVLVEDDVTLIVDPSLDVAAEGPALSRRPVDIVVNSHAHEDHFAGNSRFRDARLLLHDDDAAAMRSVDALMATYGMDAANEGLWRDLVVERFLFEPRDDVGAVRGGDTIDLGHTTVHFLHMPGHTAGHMCLLFEPDGVMFTGDLDLTWFGPYYADATASLDDTIRSLERLRGFDDLRAFVSFHEAGVVREDLAGHVERYTDVIWQREATLLDFIHEPRTLDEIAGRTIVYRRRYDRIPWQHHVEKAMMSRHVDRLVRAGRAVVEQGRVRAAA